MEPGPGAVVPFAKFDRPIRADTGLRCACDERQVWVVPCKECDAATANGFNLGAVNKGSKPTSDAAQHHMV